MEAEQKFGERLQISTKKEHMENHVPIYDIKYG
jgi:hypothetical protein